MCSVPVRIVHSAGADCMGHAIRAATDADHEATVLSIDGVGPSKRDAVETLGSSESPTFVAINARCVH